MVFVEGVFDSRHLKDLGSARQSVRIRFPIFSKKKSSSSHSGLWPTRVDPANSIVAGRNLIRVATIRTPAQAQPVRGTFKGEWRCLSWHGRHRDGRESA
jgi:hypothetical protein